MSKPTDDIQWATGGGADVSEPTLGRKQNGWATDEKPPAQWFNFMQRGYFRWIDYLTKLTESFQLTNWVPHASALGTGGSVHTLGFLNSTFLVSNNSALLAASTDGAIWRLSDLSANVRVFGYGNGLFLTAGAQNTNIYTSTNALNWTARTSQLGTEDATAIAFGNGVYTVSGVAGKMSSSPNGTTWTARTSQFGTTQITRMVFANGVFVAAGDLGKISSSVDGITWTAQTSQFGTDPILDLIYNNGLFVAVGNNGKISTSVNGTTWIAQTAHAGTDFLTSVCWTGTQFVVVGDNLRVSTSPDGVTWTARTFLHTSSTGLSKVVSDGAGLLVASVGVSPENLGVSRDGITWSVTRSGQSVTGPDLVSGLGIFVAGGDITGSDLSTTTVLL